MFLEILLTFFLVFLNGFFVAAEFAIVKVRASQLETGPEGQTRKGRAARIITEHLDEYLSATQLGITLASLGLGFVGESLVAEMLIQLFDAMGLEWSHTLAHSVAFPVAFFIITVLHIVLGELAPKSLAIRFPLPTTTYIAVPLRAFYFIFRPFIWLLNGISNAILRMIGVRPLAGHGESHSEEELRYLVAESQKAGSIDASESELIERVFNFHERISKQIMIPRTQIFAVDLELPPAEIVDQVLEAQYTRVPVYQDSLDNIIGLLYTKDLLKLVIDERVNELRSIIRPAYFVPGSKRIDSLLRKFQQEQSHMAIVTDEFGGTVGLVTLEDVIEEITGHIYDENEEAETGPVRHSTDEFVVNAQTSIIDLNEDLPQPLPESREYGTLAGLILSITRRLPEEGESVLLEGYEMTVSKRSNNRIEEVRLKQLPQPEEDEQENGESDRNSEQ